MAGRCVYIGRYKKGGNSYEETGICSSDDVAALDDGSIFCLSIMAINTCGDCQMKGSVRYEQS